MIKLFLSLLVMLFCILPAGADENKPFIAVYGDKQLVSNYRDCTHKIGLLWPTYSFEDFDVFLARAKVLAGDRDLVIDIGAHGHYLEGLYCIHQGKSWAYASAGMLFNHIDTYFRDKKNIVVVTETCYGTLVYRQSLHNSGIYVHEKNIRIESYCGIQPSYPVYGVGPYVNRNTYALEQYLHGKRDTLRDLRTDTDNLKPGKKVDNYFQSLEYTNLYNLLILDYTKP